MPNSLSTSIRRIAKTVAMSTAGATLVAASVVAFAGPASATQTGVVSCNSSASGPCNAGTIPL